MSSAAEPEVHGAAEVFQQLSGQGRIISGVAVGVIGDDVHCSETHDVLGGVTEIAAADHRYDGNRARAAARPCPATPVELN